MRQAGELAVAALAGFGVDTMFTLNGGHVWPLYDGARTHDMRIIDTRHEQSAAWAAEAWAKLTRGPGVAVLTAGPGVTNGVSAITSAYFNGAPLVVIGGRAPQGQWGSGSLQELDHVPIVATVTKTASTVIDPADTARVRLNDSTWSAGRHPRPMPFAKHGTRRCSTARASACHAPAQYTSLPAMTAGRDASAIMAAARAISSGSGSMSGG